MRIWTSTASTPSTSPSDCRSLRAASSVRRSSRASGPSAMSLTACMHFSWPRLFLPALVAASLLYPVIVYVGRAIVPPLAFVAAALALIGLRLATLPPMQRVWRVPLLSAATIIAALAALDAPLAVQAYPAAVSLAPAAQSYCRKVTIVWTAWLITNTIIAAVLALPGHDEAWALWTGLVAYFFMAALFAGEIVVRRFARGRVAKT